MTHAQEIDALVIGLVGVGFAAATYLEEVGLAVSRLRKIVFGFTFIVQGYGFFLLVGMLWERLS